MTGVQTCALPISSDQPASCGASGQRVPRNRARRSLSASESAFGLNGSGRGAASGMRRSLRADGRELKGKTRKDAGLATGDNRLRAKGKLEGLTSSCCFRDRPTLAN